MSAEAMAVGTGIQMFSNIKEANAQAASMEQQAYFKRIQSAQSAELAARERSLAIKKADRIKSAQVSALGRSGISISSASALAVMGQSAADAAEEIDAMRRSDEYKRWAIETEAGMLEGSASGVRTAGLLNALGTGARGAGQYSALTEGRKKES